MKIEVINGANLNLLGKREPQIYGVKNFEEYFQELESQYADIQFSYFQSNIEGELIDRIQKVGFEVDFILINAGGYTHTSVGIADAIGAVDSKVVEVHISHIFSRETFRHTSILGSQCVGTISGFGLDSYRLAVEACRNI